jgi:L-lactate utilization protein LutB
MIPPASSVGIGGSATLRQLGLIEEVKKRGFTVFNPLEPKLTDDEKMDLRRKALLSGVFLVGTNAITEEGQLFNIDSIGNRVGAMFFGPKKVIVVAGTNKIVKDLDEAILKVQEWTAPINAKRLKIATPCVQTGQCEDCESPGRICNIWVVIHKKPRQTDLQVVLVGETLGI